MKKIIAVDFDDTIAELIDFPTSGAPVKGAFETLRDLREAGYELVLWTCRDREYLEQALQYCRDHGFEFFYANENLPSVEHPTSNKIYYDILICDKNFGNDGKVDWSMVRSKLLGEGDSELLFNGSYLKVISPRKNAYEAIVQPHCVMCIAKDTSTGNYFIRQELVPPYEYTTGKSYWYTIISGGIEKGEKPLFALYRELKEEAGIDIPSSLNVDIKLLFAGPMNKTLCNLTALYYVEGQFSRLSPSGDGTVYEAKSMTLEVTLEEFERIACGKACDMLLASAFHMLKSKGL